MLSLVVTSLLSMSQAVTIQEIKTPLFSDVHTVVLVDDIPTVAGFGLPGNSGWGRTYSFTGNAAIPKFDAKNGQRALQSVEIKLDYFYVANADWTYQAGGPFIPFTEIDLQAGPFPYPKCCTSQIFLGQMENTSFGYSASNPFLGTSFEGTLTSRGEVTVSIPDNYHNQYTGPGQLPFNWTQVAKYGTQNASSFNSSFSATTAFLSYLTVTYRYYQPLEAKAPK